MKGRINILLAFSKSIMSDTLESLGCIIFGKEENIHITKVPINNLERVLSLKGITFIRFEKFDHELGSHPQ